MAVLATFANVEVQEVGGESFSKVAEGTLTIVQTSDRNVPAILKVENVEVPFVKDAPSGPFRKLDSKTFIMATQDLMSFYYIVFPKGTSEEDLQTADYVLGQLAKGLDATPPKKAAPVEAPAPAAAAGAPSAAAPAPANPFGQFGGVLQGLAQRAAKDTALLGEVAKKAAADTMLLAGQGAKAVQSMNAGANKPAPSKP